MPVEALQPPYRTSARPAVATPTRPSVATPTRPVVATPTRANGTTPTRANGTTPTRPTVATSTKPAVARPAVATPTKPAVATPTKLAVATPTKPAVAPPIRANVAMPNRPTVARPAVATPTKPAVAMPTRPAVAPPPWLRAKAPVGPDFYRQGSCSATPRPRQSAVERLEADKVKYVKSQVALCRQQPVGPPEGRKPPLDPGAALRPTRKTPTQSRTKQEAVLLDVKHLSSLISDVNDGPTPSTEEEGGGAPGGEAKPPSPPSSDNQQGKEILAPPPSQPNWSSPAKVRLKSSDPPKMESPAPSGAAAGAVRRVDVLPQAGAGRTSCRPPQFLRPPLQPLPLQLPLRPARSYLHLFHHRTAPGSAPLRPVVTPPKTDDPPMSTPAPPPNALAPPPNALTPPPNTLAPPPNALAPPHNTLAPPPNALAPPPNTVAPPPNAFAPLSNSMAPPPNGLATPPNTLAEPPNVMPRPPPSPAFTRLSSSSRKRPSLARSKSDVSDRFSRAGTDLERFFNLCGLDPADLDGLNASSSDIVSLARFRSVSAPGSECGASHQEAEEEDEEEEEEDGGKAAGRVPYGVSVIERNARVIKWLYGLRQAKDNAAKNTDP